MPIVTEKVKPTVNHQSPIMAAMGGKLGKRRSGPTREAQRFQWLIAQLEAAGVSQSEMARLTGIETSHINKLRNLESSGRAAIGADIVRLVKQGLKISPDYFYDDYEGQRDHRLYLLSAKRDEKRVSAIEEATAKQELAIAQMNATLAAQQTELVRLKQEVSGKQGGPVSQKRR